VAKYARYQDYVIRDGRLIGEFEQMYRDFADPWHESTAEEFASEKAVGLNLLARLGRRHGVRRVLEVGCGFGHYSARIRALGFDVLGVDISETAVNTARSRHPGVEFAVGKLDDHDLIRHFHPDVIVMAEVTWYVLEPLRPFLDFMRAELPNAFLLHMLTTYPRGVQRYGADYFTDLDSILKYFGMSYLESGEVRGAGGGGRTWFLGAWSAGAEEVWNRPVDKSSGS
jgi:SAM-dependent methyltransferase